jgi:hypothetical protein
MSLGIIQHNQFRLTDCGERQCDPLHLATRESKRLARQQMSDSEGDADFLNPVFQRAALPRPGIQVERQLIPHRFSESRQATTWVSQERTDPGYVNVRADRLTLRKLP